MSIAIICRLTGIFGDDVERVGQGSGASRRPAATHKAKKGRKIIALCNALLSCAELGRAGLGRVRAVLRDAEPKQSGCECMNWAFGLLSRPKIWIRECG